MQKYLEILKEINWNRSASIWHLRAISENGRIITNKRAALLISNVIKKVMKLPLSKEEQMAEEKLKKNSRLINRSEKWQSVKK